MRQHGLQLGVKRALDCAAAAGALVLSAPLSGAIAVAIRLTMGAPILFRQRRAGRDARPFTVLKFRTMKDSRDAAGNLLPDAERLTAVGRFVRRTSLDELPQLWNVLRGEMSLVGPRPLLEQYVPLYDQTQQRRHDVLPGLTGWAQVNGRNAKTWPEKLALDIWYVDHWSVALDARILAKTVLKVLRSEGISQPGHETMPVFDGRSAATSFEPAEVGSRNGSPARRVPS